MTHIQSTGFNAGKSTNETFKAVISMRMSGLITLSMFSALQMMEGAKLPKPEELTYQRKTPFMVPRIHVSLLAKLYSHMLPSEGDIAQEYIREEVEILIDWLSRRMLHCEEERDNRIPRNNAFDWDEQNSKFNPDSYIAMKLLLLELKAWLSYEAVEVGEAVVQQAMA